MSGIVCLVGNDLKVAAKALTLLKHRGCSTKLLDPKNNCYLGSIVGSSLYDKHCYCSDNNSQAVFDGFIYDNEEIPFARRALQLYHEYGEKFLDNLDGIFALAINNKDKFLLARDPFGLKPLYYGISGKYMLFASELKAVSPFFKKVKVFPPGHYFTLEKGFVKYFDFSTIIRKRDNKSPENVVFARKLRETLEDAIGKRLKILESKPSVLLSGGLDSSCVAASTGKYLDNFKTFTVGYKNSEDLSFARDVADYLGTSHFEYSYGLEEMINLLPEVIYYLESFDAPLVRSAIPNYIVSRLASQKNSETVFTGEGADEIFAGYSYIKKRKISNVETELRRILEYGHRTGFQRDDRMNLAFGIEYDVPFMDYNMIKLAFSIPVNLKIHGEEQTEKWILRKAYEGILPENIVWRKKQKFSVGAGSANIMGKYVDSKISDEEYMQECRLTNGTMIRSKEELLYYRIFTKLFPNSSVVNTVGRT